MNITVADLLFERMGDRIDAAAPRIGADALRGTVENLLPLAVVRLAPGQGGTYLRRLLRALNTPIPRVLVAGWRRYEEFLVFADAEEPAARSGEVRIIDYEASSGWELAPSFDGSSLSGPRLQAELVLGFEAGIVEVRDGRFVALRTGTFVYRGFVRVKEAPREVAAVGPRRLEVPNGRVAFGEGWPIRPFRTQQAG